MTRITFVRHGEVHNPRRVIYGRLPRFRLSPHGIKQATHVAEALAAESVDAVVSSPLLRARQTAARILGRQPALRLQISRDLIEVLTPYQGLPATEIAFRREDFYTDSPPPFEQPADVLARMSRFAARHARRHPGGHVVAVTHGDPIAFFALWAGGAAVTPANKTRLAPLGIGGGYPGHASATTYTVPADPQGVPVLLAYRAAPYT
jgi:probable phosphoglycerate mutase